MTGHLACLVVALPALFGIQMQNRSFAQEKKLPAFEQIFSNGEPQLLQRLPDITGWADDAHYLERRRERGDARSKLYAVDVRSGEEKVIRDLSGFRDVVGKDIEVSSPATADEGWTRLVYVKEKDLYYLNTATKEFRRLTETREEEKNPTMAPDGGAVAFTRGNDLYSINLATGKETRYTMDGGPVTYNGWASWVYMEEILGRARRYRAFWWSPDSRYIVFYRFDDSMVPEFPLFSASEQHGRLEKIRYPKAGDPNPSVRVGVVSAGEPGHAVWAAFDESADQYFGTPFWAPDGKSLLLQWMNRAQDTLKLFRVNPSTGARKEIYREHQASWVDWLESIPFVGRSGDFILESDRDGWTHLYLYSAEGVLKRRLTSGEWAVTGVELVDTARGLVYFTAKKESSTRRDLYRVAVNGGGVERLTFGEYSHTVMVSPGGSYFITRYENLETPTRAAAYSTSGTRVRDLGDSKSREFDFYAWAKSELVRVVTTDGYALPMTIMLPLNLEPGKRYPVLISIYGGPGEGTVSERWKGLEPQWWAQEGIIQVAVDHRGSGHFGKRGEALMHRNLGKWEMFDYIEAVKWLRAKPYVDSARICITGGSYGGYVTAMALTYGADYFTHGIASYSVTDWRLYDSHYTERYMDTPSENPEGYAFGSVLTHAGKYRGLLRIVHGTMDDNVHMQNTIQLVDTLESLGKHFEMMLYPGGRHGWGGAKGTHARNEMYRFYYERLLGKPFPEQRFRNLRPRMGRRGEEY